MNITILLYFILFANGSFIKHAELEPITEPIQSQAFVHEELSRIKRYAVTAWQSERSKKMDKIAFQNLIKFMRERTGQVI